MQTLIQIALAVAGCVVLAAIAGLCAVAGLLWLDGRRYNKEHDLP